MLIVWTCMWILREMKIFKNCFLVVGCVEWNMPVYKQVNFEHCILFTILWWNIHCDTRFTRDNNSLGPCPRGQESSLASRHPASKIEWEFHALLLYIALTMPSCVEWNMSVCKQTGLKHSMLYYFVVSCSMWHKVGWRW